MKKERVTYIAEDGKIFYSKRRCELYNAVKDKTLEEIISPYLTFLYEKENGRHWEISGNICVRTAKLPIESSFYLEEILGVNLCFGGYSPNDFYEVLPRWDSDTPGEYRFKLLQEKQIRHHLSLLNESLNKIEKIKEKVSG
jgi:hypothetical protein